MPHYAQAGTYVHVFFRHEDADPNRDTISESTQFITVDIDSRPNDTAGSFCTTAPG